MLYPAQTAIKTQRMYTESFLGLDRRPRAADGAFFDMENMTGDPIPLISSRKRRGLLAQAASPRAMTAAGKLAYIAGNTLYYDGEATPINDLTEETPKRMAVMGAYIVVFPDGKYYNTIKPEDHGSINRLYASQGNVTYTLCRMDGTEYGDESITTGNDAPENPKNGALWLDTGRETHALKRYSAVYGSWESVPTVYTRIGAQGIGAGLKKQDGVEISGIAYAGDSETLKKQYDALNGTSQIQACGNDYIVIIGLVDQQYTQTAGAVRADRKAPQMDLIIECNNRLWGCRHGETDGQTLNEIYACALGDFKNWRKYTGVQGAYTVSVGTDGEFTGAINHRGQPYFFKEGALHKILGDAPSNYEMQTTLLEGVKKGSEYSLVSVNGTLYYHGITGICQFDSLPYTVSKPLGDGKFHGAAAGEKAGKYYVSMADEAGEWSVYCLDTEQGTWWRQDGKRALAFARIGDEIYMLEDTGAIWALEGTAGTLEGPVEWRMDSAEMGYEYPDRKYIWRFNVRMMLGQNAECEFFIQYDSSGVWERQGYMEGRSKPGTYTLPILPRRCDHLKIRIQGKGEMQLYSIARLLAVGADG